jgi:hypothetical protein
MCDRSDLMLSSPHQFDTVTPENIERNIWTILLKIIYSVIQTRNQIYLRMLFEKKKNNQNKANYNTHSQRRKWLLAKLLKNQQACVHLHTWNKQKSENNMKKNRETGHKFEAAIIEIYEQ